MEAKRNNHRQPQINVTPLIDVVLVLLIIFMVLTPTLLKEVDVAVPEKATLLVDAKAQAKQLVLTISQEGNLSLDGEPLLASALIPRIHALMAARKDRLIFFDVDDQANYGEVVHVMDSCRGAGAKILGIMSK